MRAWTSILSTETVESPSLVTDFVGDCFAHTWNLRSKTPKWNAVLLEKGVDLESRLEAKKTASLAFRQRSGPITLDGKRFNDLLGGGPANDPREPRRYRRAS